MFQRLAQLGGVLLVLLATFQTATAIASSVVGVRAGEQSNATRFVLDLSDDVAFKVFLLDRPYRVVVDFPVLDWRVEGVPEIQQGLIDGYRFGLFDRTTSRLVLDVNRPVEVRRSFILPPSGSFPHRFVIDLGEVSADRFQRAAVVAPSTEASKSSAPAVSPEKAADGPRIVVLDPGHGGIDPGAIGRRGAREKAVTLAVAKETKRVLEEAGGYEVLLTRDTDIFVRLRDRVAFAHQNNADLFISLHADSIEDRRVRGASVYTLSETASDREAEALARRENKADLIGGIDLENQPDDVATILIDLTQRETMNLSAAFAAHVLPEIRDTGKTLRKGHRFAGFAVLKSPDVPSVLLELGYLSNPTDERQLTSPAFQREIAKAVKRAVDSYFSELSQ